MSSSRKYASKPLINYKREYQILTFAGSFRDFPKKLGDQNLYLNNLSIQDFPDIVRYLQTQKLNWKGKKLVIECDTYRYIYGNTKQQFFQSLADLLEFIDTQRNIVSFHLHLNLRRFHRGVLQEFAQCSKFIQTLFGNPRIKDLVLPFEMFWCQYRQHNTIKKPNNIPFLKSFAFSSYSDYCPSRESGYMNRWDPSVCELKTFEIWRERGGRWNVYVPCDKYNSFCAKMAARLGQNNFKISNRQNAITTLLLIYYAVPPNALNKLSKDMLIYLIKRIPHSKEWPRYRRKPGELKVFKLKRKIHQTKQSLKNSESELEDCKKRKIYIDDQITYFHKQLQDCDLHKTKVVKDIENFQQNISKFEKDIIKISKKIKK